MAAPRLTAAARRRRRWFLLVGATAVAMLATLALGAVGVIDSVEQRLVDARFSVRGPDGSARDTVIVAVDDKTFRSPKDGGIGSQWPFARRRHAQIVRRLAKDGAKVIAYDVQFTEASARGPADDEALLQAVYDADHSGHQVVLGTTEVRPDGSTKVFGGGALLKQIGAKVGNAIIPAEKGAVVRRVPYRHDGLISFPVVAAEAALGHTVPASRFRPRPPYINFAGPPRTVETVSYSDVIYGRFKKGTFKNKVVVVGATAPSLQDLSATSTSGNGLMSGPELQASAIQTILDDFPLGQTPAWLRVLLTILFILIPPVLGTRHLPLIRRRIPPLVGFGVAIVVGGLYLVLAQILFNNGRVIPVAAPLTGLALSAICTLAVLVVMEASDRRRIHDLFARFVPEKVVDQVVANADDELRLGGELREATVLFSDLRGFTTYSESREPAAVIEILNEYLGEMTDAILDAGGTLVAYLGDGILAVFGAPLDQPDHADRALRSARDMLDRLEEFNRTMVPKDQDPFKMGIGLNTGAIISGNVGSERRLEYTTIGDTVNTASRIEGMTKGSPFSVLLADSTVEALSAKPEDLEFHEDVPIRGRSETVRLWGLSQGRKVPLGEEEAVLTPAGSPGTPPDRTGGSAGDSGT